MQDTNLEEDAFIKRFTEWAAKTVLRVLYSNPSLEEEQILDTLKGYETDTLENKMSAEDIVLVVMGQVKTLADKYKEHKGTLYGSIIKAALDAQLEELKDQEAVVRNHDQNLRLVRIFIQAIKSSMLEDEGE